MQTLFSIILPLLAIRLFLNSVPSLSLSSPSSPPLTATAQYFYLNHIGLPAFSLVFIRRSSSPFHPSATLSPPGTLELGPELLRTPFGNPPLIRRSARE